MDFFVDCWTCNIVVDGAGFVIKGWTEGTDSRFVDVFVDCWTCSVVDAETGGFVECCVDVYDDIWAFVVFTVIWFFPWPLLEPTVNIS